MPDNKIEKHVFWFDDHKTPNVADALADESGIQLHRLDFDGPQEENWVIMEKSHVYCITSSRDEIPDQYKGTPALVERCQSLLAISASGAGYDPVDVATCTEAGVLVVNQSGANAQAVAEHVVAMMLSLTKHVMESDRSLRKERGVSRETFKGRNAHGRTLGIIGLGNVGRRVAHICGNGLNMRLIAYDPYLSAAQCETRGATQVTLDELLSEADFVSINCPFNAETRSMIGRRELAMMPSQAYLITTARGGIVDEDALADALEQGEIAGAGIDVWNVEPPPLVHRLLAFDNVVATFHTAGVTVDSRELMAKWNAQQVLQILNGQYPPRLINPEAWDKFALRFEKAFGFAPQGPAKHS